MALPAVAVAATYLSVLLTVPDSRTWAAAAALAGQLILPAALASAAFLCIACRLYPRDGVAWLAAAATLVGVQSLPLLADSTDSSLRSPVALSSAVVVGILLLVTTRLARRYTLRASPVPVGVGIGLLLLLGRAGWSRWSPSVPAPDLPSGDSALADLLPPVELAVLLLVSLVIGVLVTRTSTLPVGPRRVSASVVLWSVGVGLSAAGWTTTPAWAVVAILASTTTCVLFSSAALDLLWVAVQDDQAAALRLQIQLRTLRAHAREDIEHLHEVKGSIAGIASASELIRHEARLSHQHRERLEEMLAVEAARLQRLIHTHATHAPAELADLDDVVRPLVLARRAQGHDVTWTASETPVRVEADSFAEVVSILLHNASVHAAHSRVHVYTRLQEGELQLVVADSGPGVPPDLQANIFDWGRRGSDSDGQGVGLARAASILTDLGMTLTLDTSHSPGAAFVVALAHRTAPTAPRTRTALAS
ncbi:sensor histidine kinase [Nocardioides sp. URHA0020]|uniref:sensor histidine kinase n=1 Tax=Nocardioides sp. URHA0020 TaxID=1380392 RepID=UPI00048F5BDC|nr:HAMP domain-containing sensor histidine kinase [Nocardioides sp. URHA0020]